MVPNFTGRQSECEDIIRHVTSESTRLVSICGSPGFGKTSVAIAVGHAVQSRGIPVYWISLRGLHSKADLTSKFLSFLSQPTTQTKRQRLSIDDEICLLFSELSKPSVVILDNADDLLETGCPKMKEEVTQLLGEILRRNQKVTFVVTARESLDYIDLNFQGHWELRINPLDDDSAQTLVSELLPNAGVADSTEIAHICGQVPLAMRLLCSLVSEENSAQPRHFLDVFMTSSTGSLVEMLDHPDYPARHRLQLLFDSSFQRLTAHEQEVLVSLSILPDNFSTEVAAAVLGKTGTIETTKILGNLRRKSLIDSSSKPGIFTMHKLLQSFVVDKGEQEMTETIVASQGRLKAFYISRFEKLNQQFLSGHSMAAYIGFYEDKEKIIESLIDSCSDSKTADRVFDILVKGEWFLHSLFWIPSEGKNFEHIYDAAIKAANKHSKEKYLSQLLCSRAFKDLANGTGGKAKNFLSKVNKIQAASPLVPHHQKGKYFCYLGIHNLIARELKIGVQCLRKALSSLDNCSNPEQKILKLVTFQILAVYYGSINDLSSASSFYDKALNECSGVEDRDLLLITSMTRETKETTNEIHLQSDSQVFLNQPLKCEIAFLLNQATMSFCDFNTMQYTSSLVLRVLESVETEVKISVGLLCFQRVVTHVLWLLSCEDPVKLYTSRINYHKTVLEKCKNSSCEKEDLRRYTNIQNKALAKYYIDLAKVYLQRMNYPHALQATEQALLVTKMLFGEEHESTADSYRELGVTQHAMHDYKAALQSHQRALDIRIKLFGKEHESTADSYKTLGVTQHQMHDYNAALQSKQSALAIRIKLFGEEHESTAESYKTLGVTQHQMHDYNAALQSKQSALAIRIKLFPEEHKSTADSYGSLGITQREMHEYEAALQSHQRALAIRIKLFGEEHKSTADSYRELGATQHAMHDYKSALQSKQRALAIRIKLFPEEHKSTADGYKTLGVTQHQMHDYKAALHSHQRALAIRIKLFGEEHKSTADSYRELGATQHAMHDYKSALQSKQRALAIRIKLFPEEHKSTADSYGSLGITQREMHEYEAALQSHQRALAIRIKLFGEEHESTADSYKTLGVTQHEMRDYEAALQSSQRALDIRIKLFGEEHESTADSYRELGVTQHAMHDYKAALQSHQRALDIRIKLFGKEHESTADSYFTLGVTQHSMHNYRAALQSKQRALAIRIKLFREENESIADSYGSLGVTQHQMHDYKAALHSHQRALAIRIKLFGEEHESTADSYFSLGVTQHKMHDYKAARHSHQRALAICIKLIGQEHESTADSYGGTRSNTTQHNTKCMTTK